MRHAIASTRFRRPAFLLCAICLATPAPAEDAASVLATCEGAATDAKETKTAAFTLPGESTLKIVHEISANPEGASPKVTVRLRRKLPTGTFVTVKTLSDLAQSGETEGKPFPAGDYQLEVTATQAAFRATVVRE